MHGTPTVLHICYYICNEVQSCLIERKQMQKKTKNRFLIITYKSE